MRQLKTSEIGIACEILSHGGLVAFPTETVYGLGGNAYSDVVVSKIFRYKDRPTLNPISVCYKDIKQADADVELTDLALKLAGKFMPGPITIILNRKDKSKVSWLCSAGRNTLGIRIPDCSVALSILNNINFPLAVPSANKSQGITPTTAQDVIDSLDTNEDLTVVDGGGCSIGIESTIVDLTESTPIVTRLGAIGVEELQKATDMQFVIQARNITKHYQPNKKIVINSLSANKNDGFLGFGPIQRPQCKCFINLSSKGNIIEAAQNFFAALHQLENRNDIEKICIAPIPNEGIGKAINYKLQQMLDYV